MSSTTILALSVTFAATGTLLLALVFTARFLTRFTDQLTARSQAEVEAVVAALGEMSRTTRKLSADTSRAVGDAIGTSVTQAIAATQPPAALDYTHEDLEAVATRIIQEREVEVDDLYDPTDATLPPGRNDVTFLPAGEWFGGGGGGGQDAGVGGHSVGGQAG